MLRPTVPVGLNGQDRFQSVSGSMFRREFGKGGAPKTGTWPVMMGFGTSTSSNNRCRASTVQPANAPSRSAAQTSSCEL